LRFGVVGREFPPDLGAEPVAVHADSLVGDVAFGCCGERAGFRCPARWHCLLIQFNVTHQPTQKAERGTSGSL
jgi:hypothetical protein